MLYPAFLNFTFYIYNILIFNYFGDWRNLSRVKSLLAEDWALVSRTHMTVHNCQ